MYESMKWTNLQFVNPRTGISLRDLKEVIYKPDNEMAEFKEKMLSTSQGLIANLYREECDVLVREGIRDA